MNRESQPTIDFHSHTFCFAAISAAWVARSDLRCWHREPQPTFTRCLSLSMSAICWHREPQPTFTPLPELVDGSLPKGKNKGKKQNASSLLMLTDQGSNLDSSESKSDVLPVTPSVNPNLAVQIYKILSF